MQKFVSPSFNLTAFNCPHCGAYSQMNWEYLHNGIDYSIHLATCQVCFNYNLWRRYGFSQMVRYN